MPYRRCCLVLAVFWIFVCATATHADNGAVGLAQSRWSAVAPRDEAALRRDQAWLLNLGAVGIVTLWGVFNWDYFSRAPGYESEHWFGHDTAEGGADKMGHLWASYALSHGFAAAYQRIGYPAHQARRYAPWSALAVTGLMEVGDSFSAEHGFSGEDMLANVVGAGIGWLLLNSAHWQQRIDLRWEYRPDFDDFHADVTTDYQNSKYLVAIKAEGFEQIKNKWLQLLEVHLGYYARHYHDYRTGQADRRRRVVYVGVGINMGRLLRPCWDSRLFNYFQLPATYIEGRHARD